MKKLAIITARGGSKRIPRKNIKDFLGKPIIAYSIEAALKSDLFDEVMVSTDDQEIADIALEYGAKVPFMRSNKNADDFATTVDVILEVIEDFSQTGLSFDHVCCLYPTAPFVNSELLKKSFHKMIDGNFDTIFPTVRFAYPIQRALQESNNRVTMVWEEHLRSRSQDLTPRYHDAGQFYWCKTESIIAKKTLFTDNSGFYEVNELAVQDIDNETDWKLAELKYNLKNE